MNIYRLTLIALLLLLGACAGTERTGQERLDRNVITRAELDDIDRSSVYDAVTALRPMWLQTRGRKSARPENEGYIVVYIDNFRQGPPETLQSISLDSVHTLQFLSPAVANNRYGIGHWHGVILVTTR